MAEPAAFVAAGHVHDAMDVDPPPPRTRRRLDDQLSAPTLGRAQSSGPVIPSLLSSSINLASLPPREPPRRRQTATNPSRSASPPRDRSTAPRPPSSPLKRLGEYRTRHAWGGRPISPNEDRPAPRRARSHQDCPVRGSTSPGPWNRLTSLFGHSAAPVTSTSSAFVHPPSTVAFPTASFRVSHDALPALGDEEGEMVSPPSSPVPPPSSNAHGIVGGFKGKSVRQMSSDDGGDCDDEEDLRFSMTQDEACFVDSFPSPSRSRSGSGSPFASLHGSLVSSAQQADRPRRVDFLTELPVELALTTLLSIEDHETLQACLRVSRRWNYLASDACVWRHLFDSHAHEGWKIRDDALNGVPALPRRPSSRSAPSTPAPAEPGMRLGRKLSEMLGELGGLTIAPLGGGGGTEAIDRPNQPRPPLGRLRSSQQQAAPAIWGSRRPSTQPEAPGLDWYQLYRDRWRLQERWRNGVMEKQFLRGHEDSVYCLQFDQEKIVTGSRDKAVKIWDSQTGALVQTLFGHAGSVLCLRYDGPTLLTGSSDCCVFVWALSNPSSPSSTPRVLRKLVGHSSGVLDVNFDPRHVVSCSKDTSIRIWDRARDYVHVRTLQGHSGPVNAIQLKGDLLLSASGDSLMKLWNVVTGEVVRVFAGHSRGLACVRWVGELVVSGSNDQTIKVWDVATAKCLRTLTGHGDLVRAVAVDPASDRLVSGSYDNTVKIWDFSTGELMLDCQRSQTSLVFDVQLDVSRVVAVGHHPAVMVLNFGKGLDCTKFV